MNEHWTARSTEDFVHRISSDFVFQIENKMDEIPISQADFAKRLDVSEGRVSQILRDPGNMTLKKMVECARALGLKVAVVAYDDHDPQNNNGPINSQIFTASWKRLGSPIDFFAFHKCATNFSATLPVKYIEPLRQIDEGDTFDVRVFDGLGWSERQPATSTVIQAQAR